MEYEHVGWYKVIWEMYEFCLISAYVALSIVCLVLARRYIISGKFI